MSNVNFNTRVGRNKLNGGAGIDQLKVDLLDKIRLGALVNYSTQTLFSGVTVTAGQTKRSATLDNKDNCSYTINLYANLAAGTGNAGKVGQTITIETSIDGVSFFELNHPINIFVDSNTTPIVNDSINLHKRFFRFAYKNGDSSSRVLTMNIELIKKGI